MDIELRDDERRLLGAIARHFSAGKRVGRRQLLLETGIPPHTYSAVQARLLQLGLLSASEVPTERALRYCGRAIPTFPGDDTALRYASPAAQRGYEMMKAVFSAKNYLPGAAELSRLLGVTRQRAHQLIQELSRLEAIPTETRRVRKET